MKIENLNVVDGMICDELNKGKKIQIEYDKRDGTIKLLKIDTKKIATVAK
jgi:hypothetical protein